MKYIILICFYYYYSTLLRIIIIKKIYSWFPKKFLQLNSFEQSTHTDWRWLAGVPRIGRTWRPGTAAQSWWASRPRFGKSHQAEPDTAPDTRPPPGACAGGAGTASGGPSGGARCPWAASSGAPQTAGQPAAEKHGFGEALCWKFICVFSTCNPNLKSP